MRLMLPNVDKQNMKIRGRNGLNYGTKKKDKELREVNRYPT